MVIDKNIHTQQKTPVPGKNNVGTPLVGIHPVKQINIKKNNSQITKHFVIIIGNGNIFVDHNEYILNRGVVF